MRWALALAAPAPALDLAFGPDGAFRVLLFCDLHFGENEAHDAKSVSFERTLLALEKPDLVHGERYARSFWALL